MVDNSPGMRGDFSISGGDGGGTTPMTLAAPWLALAGALAALCAAAALPAAAAAAAKPVQAKNLIVHPAPGKLLPARPTAIQVRAGRGARLGMKLNGKPIGRWLSRPSRRGLRHLRVSPSHGLRHGRNVLLVRVRHRGAKRARVQRIGFRVRGNRPLAAAGLDRRVALHSGFSLTSHRSLAHPTGRGQPLRYRWRLLQAPRGSRLGVAQRRSGKSSAGRGARVRNLGPGPHFARRAKVRPRLRFDHPGRYRLQLTVRGPDGRVGSDEVTVVADPDPAVSFNTMAQPQGKEFWGVQVGKQFYEDPGKGRQWLQLVVLDATTLEGIANKSFACPAATNVGVEAANLPAVKKCVSDVTGYANELPKKFPQAGGFLAIAASQLSRNAERDQTRLTGESQSLQRQPRDGPRHALLRRPAGGEEAAGGEHRLRPGFESDIPQDLGPAGARQQQHVLELRLARPGHLRHPGAGVQRDTERDQDREPDLHRADYRWWWLPRGRDRQVSAYVQEIAAEIDKLVEPQPNETTMLIFEDILDGAREVANALPFPAGTVAEGFNVLWNLMMHMGKTFNEAGTQEAGEPFSVTAGKLGVEVAKRLEVARSTLEDQLVDVIAADYGKLRTVGLCAPGRDGCPSPARWTITQQNEKEMATAIERGMKAAIFNALLPVKWPAWLVYDNYIAELGTPESGFVAARSTWWHRPDWERTYTPALGTEWSLQECPFKQAAATGQFWLPVVRAFGPSGYDGNRTQSMVVVFSTIDWVSTSVSGFSWELPKAAVTDALFKPLAEGGLGLDPETFWRRAYDDGALNSYPFTTSGLLEATGSGAASTHWISDSHIFRAPSCTR